MSILSDLYTILFIEKRLPFRVEKFIQDLLYKDSTQRVINKVLMTPPIQVAESAKAEIRVLTNDTNVNMTILALKSFLRFCRDVKVVIHDDGTVSEESKNRILEHIIGAEIISMEEADTRIRAKNEGLWNLRKEAFSYFRFMPITVYKLFDLYLLAQSNKLIIMDSDVLFLKEPREVIEWIKHDKRFNLHARPYLRNLIIDDAVIQEKFGNLNVIKKFNSGLLCMRKDLVKFDYVLEALNKLKGDEGTPILGDECIWRFAFSMTESRELPFKDYPLFSKIKYFKKFLKKNPQPGYVHFLLKHKGGFYSKFAKQVVGELKNEVEG